MGWGGEASEEWFDSIGPREDPVSSSLTVEILWPRRRRRRMRAQRGHLGSRARNFYSDLHTSHYGDQ